MKEFAEKTGIQVPQVISELMKNGILANINQQIDYDTAAVIAEDLGVKIKKSLKDVSSEDFLSGDLEKLLQDEQENMVERPPIVTVMGHVDHGKTRLLDAIRNSNVIEKEAGGITQHIGAYQVVFKEKKITFLDTPGHEAFTAMRARGAKVTDIAILVVAADEGVKPQTIEAIDHAKDAHVPIIVAINKIDKKEANIDRVKGELAELDLTPEDWGGKTIVVPISAAEGTGIDDILDMILLVAEINKFMADPNRPGIGVVIESHLDSSLGPIATTILKTGTLKLMDNIIVGESLGRVKLLEDENGQKLNKIVPSGVAKLVGPHKIPQVGDILQVVKDEKTARDKLQEIAHIKETRKKGGESMIIQRIINKIQAGKLKTLKIVLKADTKGSLEALHQVIEKIENKEVLPKIIHSGVGGITESDVMMASASQGILVGFNVLVSKQITKIAQREGIDIKIFKIIYELIDDIKKILTGLLEPEIIEVITGHAEVKQVFLTKKKKMIIGCKVLDGIMKVKTKIRIKREEELLGEGFIGSIKKVKEDVKEIKAGHDCGIEFEGDIKIQESDILEGYKMEEKKRTFD